MARFNALALSKIVDQHREGLNRLLAMWLDPEVLFYDDTVDKKEQKPKILLHGPNSPEGITDYMWSRDAVHYLRKYGFQGTIFIPCYRGASSLAPPEELDFSTESLDKSNRWWKSAMLMSNAIVFWVPYWHEFSRHTGINRTYFEWEEKAKHDEVTSQKLFIGSEGGNMMKCRDGAELKESGAGLRKRERFTDLKKLCQTLAGHLAPFEDDISF